MLPGRVCNSRAATIVCKNWHYDVEISIGKIDDRVGTSPGKQQVVCLFRRDESTGALRFILLLSALICAFSGSFRFCYMASITTPVDSPPPIQGVQTAYRPPRLRSSCIAVRIRREPDMPIG